MAFLFGVLLIVPGVFLLGAAIGVPLLAASDDRLIGLAISVGSALGALLCFSISRRLITNRSRPDGGLVSPAFLLGSAALFAFLPLFALATGSWRSIKTAPEMTAIQMTMYFWIATVLFRLARARKAGGSEPSSAGSSGPALARLAAERRKLGRFQRVMSCECSQLPDVVKLDDDSAIGRFDELETGDWERLVRCPRCGQLWSVDKPDGYTRSFAIKMPRREGWREFDTTPLRRQYLVQSRGGLTDENCIWLGCEQRRVRGGVVYCADHLYETGARE